MKLNWQPQALEDLETIRAYVSQDKRGAAAHLVLTILSFLEEQLTIVPETGRTGRVEGTRELVVLPTPYIVAYRIKSGAIDILAVHHTARHWPETS